MKVVIAGEQARELVAALGVHGVDAELVPAAESLTAALVGIEAKLEGETPDAAVSVGTGDSPFALAMVAAKLGVPLAACLAAEPDPDSVDGAEHRILRVLAGECFELDDAERLLAWLNANA